MTFRPSHVPILAARLLLACVIAPIARASEEPPPPPPIEAAENAPLAPPATVQSEPTPAAAGDEAATPAAPAVEREPIRLSELVTVMNSAHLRADETTPEMVTIMGNAIVDGTVNGDCVTVMGNVTVNGRIRGDLVCVLGQVTLGPGAEVRGEVVAVGGGVHLDPTARIRGEKVAITIPGLGGFGGWIGDWFRDGLGKARILPYGHSWALSAAAVFLVLNVLFAAMFGGAVQASARALEARPVLSFVNGALVLLLMPVLLILLVASVVGMLLVPFALAGLFLCWFIGTIGVFAFCGQQFGLTGRVVPAVLAGNLVFLLLYAVPVVGFAVWSVTALMGLGAAITALGQRRRDAKAAARDAAPVAPQPVMPTVEVAPATPVYMAPPAPFATAPVAGVSQASPPQGGAGETARVVFTPHIPVTSQAEQPAGPPLRADPPPAAGWTPAAAAVPAGLPPLPVDATGERAPFWPRLGALTVDFLFVAIASAFISAPPPLFVLLLLGYHAAFWSWRATTPGGIVFNLRIVRLDHTPITPAVAIVRALGGVFSMLPAGLGFIWVSFDESRQAWHDKLAGTVVVRVSRSAPLI